MNVGHRVAARRAWWLSGALAAVVIAGLPATPAHAQTADPKPALAGVAAANPGGSQPKGWEFEVTPYLWGAGLSGDIAAGQLQSQGVEASFSDLLQVLDVALMTSFEGRKDRWGFLLDTIYIDLSKSEPTPEDQFGDADVNLTEQLYTLGGTYRLSEGKVPIDVVFGARYVDLQTDLELTSGIAQGREESRGVNWWDAIAGVRVRWAFAKHWALLGYGDIGGGGSNLSWQAIAGVDWDFSKHLSGRFGYRILSLDYDKDDFSYDMEIAGPYAGLGIRF